MSMVSNLNISNAMPRIIEFQITHAEVVDSYAVSITTVDKPIFSSKFVKKEELAASTLSLYTAIFAFSYTYSARLLEAGNSHIT